MQHKSIPVREFWKSNCLVPKRRKFLPVSSYSGYDPSPTSRKGCFTWKVRIYVCIIHLFLEYLMKTFYVLYTLKSFFFNFSSFMKVDWQLKLCTFKAYKVMMWYMCRLDTLIDVGNLKVINTYTVSALMVQMATDAQNVFIFFFFVCIEGHMELPYQGSNLCSLHWSAES